jgi:hypothetical protein
MQVLGISFEEMGIAIAQQWGFPPLIVSTMRKLPAGRVKKAVAGGPPARLSSFSNELCDVIAQATPEAREREMKKTMAALPRPFRLMPRKFSKPCSVRLRKLPISPESFTSTCSRPPLASRCDSSLKAPGETGAVNAERMLIRSDGTLLKEKELDDPYGTCRR